MLPSLFLSSTAITLFTRGFYASSKFHMLKYSCIQSQYVWSSLTWNIEEFFRFQSATLVFVNLAKVFVQLLQLFLGDFKNWLAQVDLEPELQLRFLSCSCSLANCDPINLYLTNEANHTYPNAALL